jgi:multidrug efflux system membrane fusion protein
MPAINLDEVVEAEVQADKAALENDRLQLTYCFIRSPINGRTGSLMVDRGNLIKAQADTPMLIINQIQPVYVLFSVPEPQLPEIRRHMAGGILKVGAFPSGDKNPVQGVLTFVDNTVDVTTGTIRLKATFDNQDERLWPGQFVHVALTLTTEPHALVVSSSAIQTGQDGQYVYVVKRDNTVESRTVVVTRTVGDETVIERGLDPGETVVTDGQLRLIPGASVEIKNTADGGKPR